MRILRRAASSPRGSRAAASMASACSRRSLRAALAEPRQMLVELRADRLHRIERGHRRLRNEGDGAAEQGAPPRRRHAPPDLRRRTAASRAVIEKPGGSSCAMARPIMVLPAPDSPTRPRIFPGARSNDSARMTGTTSPPRRALIVRFAGLQGQHGVSVRFPQAARRACGATRRPAD